MKKLLFATIAVFSVISALNVTVFAQKYKSIERVLNPVASVYTNWGDESQTDQKYDYNYVVMSSDGYTVLTSSNYWQKPQRALYYKFDLTTLTEQGYSLVEAVVVQDGPDKNSIRFIDCPDDTLENGQNYLTVPKHQTKSFKDFDCEKVNIGFSAVTALYPDVRNADSVFDITDYVQSKLSSGKTSFTYMVYPYTKSTRAYFINHAKLYVKMQKSYNDVLFVNCNEQNMLNVSGETGASMVNVVVTDSNGRVIFDESNTLDSEEAYYRFVFDMNGLSYGEYTVTGSFDGDKLVKTFTYIPKENKDSSIYTSVDYRTGIVRIYGTLNQKNNDAVMLTVLNPGYSQWDYSDTNAVNHIEVSGTDKGYYDFSFKLNGEAGSYNVIVQGVYGEAKASFEYYPDSQTELDNEIDKYTTTYYAPWLLNWHMTKQEQIDAQYYGGEAGQMCWSMAISPVNPDVVLVGTDTNCIWKSTDGGKSWRNTSAGFEIMGTADIVFDPEDENIVYVLGSTGVSNSESPYAGIYKSYDCGETWERVFDNYYYRVKNNHIIAFSQRDENGTRRIFAGGHGVGVGSVYSDDEGETWNPVNNIPSNATVKDVVVKDNVVLFATGMGLFVSYDNGEAFEEVGPVSQVGYTATIDPTDYAHWICATDTTIYETLDSGATWEIINTTTKNISSVRYGIGDDPILYLYLSLEHYPLRYSTDDGITFIIPSKTADSTEFIKDNRGWGGEPFELHPTDKNSILVSFDGELFKSDDAGKTYYASSSGYSGMRASDFLFDTNDENNIFLSFIDRGVVKTVDSGEGEKYPIVNYDASEDSTGIRYGGSKTTLAMARDPKNPDRIIINIGGNGYALKQSYDNGDNYTIIGSAGEVSTRCIEFNQDNPYTIYAGKKISYDDGVTWTTSEVEVMAVSPVDGNTVYGMNSRDLARSDDEGRTWKIVAESIGSVSSITPDLFEKDAVYTASYSKIVHVFSDGTTEEFSPHISEIENSEQFVVLSVAQNPRNPKHLLAGGTDNSKYGKSGGIYESLDGGKKWRVVSGMPASRDIWKIEFHPLLPRAYVATSSGTFVYEYEKYYGKNIVVTDSDFEVVSGKLDDGRYKVDCSMTVWNTTETLYDAMVVYAVYDSDTKKLIRAYKQDIRLNPTNNATVNKTVNIGENDFVKIHIWSDKCEPLPETYGWQILKNIKK